MKLLNREPTEEMLKGLSFLPPKKCAISHFTQIWEAMYDAAPDNTLSIGWIDCKERLPKDGEKVIGFEDFTKIGKKYQGAETYFYRKDIGFVYRPKDDDPYGCITHWIPFTTPVEITTKVNIEPVAEIKYYGLNGEIYIIQKENYIPKVGDVFYSAEQVASLQSQVERFNTGWYNSNVEMLKLAEECSILKTERDSLIAALKPVLAISDRKHDV